MQIKIDEGFPIHNAAGKRPVVLVCLLDYMHGWLSAGRTPPHPAMMAFPWPVGTVHYWRKITYTCMHACARALHDAELRFSPAAGSLLQLVWVQKLGWGRRFRGWYCCRKFSQKQKKEEKKYCTVEIPIEMEFTSTFQKYLQCANRT